LSGQRKIEQHNNHARADFAQRQIMLSKKVVLEIKHKKGLADWPALFVFID
jgi:hypothetical protein